MKDKTWEEMDRKFKQRMAENEKKLAKQRKKEAYENWKKTRRNLPRFDDRQITLANYGFNVAVQFAKRLGDRNE
jgi:hypothetical protein|tara:strand:- start:1528 stop:1749 length:222 start_codon:yes stop_codon:yes gene_type:complete